MRMQVRCWVCQWIHEGNIFLFSPCFWRKTLHTHLTLLNAVFMPRCLAAAEDPSGWQLATGNWQPGGWQPGNLAAGDGGQGLMALAQSTSMPAPTASTGSISPLPLSFRRQATHTLNTCTRKNASQATRLAGVVDGWVPAPRPVDMGTTWQAAAQLRRDLGTC
jgi:hypothetical protein